MYYWDRVKGSNKNFQGYYPGLHWLPNGELFFSRTGWKSHGSTVLASRFGFSNPTSGSWTDFAQMHEPDRKEGSSVLLIDDTGDQARGLKSSFQAEEAKDERLLTSVRQIDVSNPTNATQWQHIASMNYARIGVSSVILPNGTIMVVGGKANL